MSLLVLGTIDSTMDVAREMLKQGQVDINGPGASEPFGVLALEQTEGRGQRGRSWYSREGESLCVTYFIKWSKSEMERAAHLAMVAGVGVVRALDSIFRFTAAEELADKCHTVSEFDIGMKWPNDILISGKKVGGILVEMVHHADGTPVAMIGVGVNINNMHFPAEIASVSTSLALEGYPSKPVQVLGTAIYEFLSDAVTQYRSGGFAVTLAQYRRFDRTTGRRYRIDGDAGVRYGLATGIDELGGLVVSMEDGSLQTIRTASVLFEVPISTPG